MKKLILGVIKEGKTPPDFRVPLTPKQCKILEAKFPHVEVVVQSSQIRTFSDAEYKAEGVTIQDSLENCDIILGVKEVKTEDLIPNKTFLFFSHTIKKQPYNRRLLQTIMEKKIRLIDYEVLKNRVGKRLIGFGRYAGIVGAFNGIRTFGLKSGLFELKKAAECADRIEMEKELEKVTLPSDFKIVLTGFGRVGYGAREIMDLLPIKEVSPEEFLTHDFDEPVFTHLEVEDYFAPKDGSIFEKQDFYKNGGNYKSIFAPYAIHADMYIACHYWSSSSPFILTQKDLQSPISRLKVVADVSCDINGPIASTLKASTIVDPIYGYDPHSGEETDFKSDNAIAVMAVDNLPCELPKDASEDFGNELLKHIFPVLFGDDPDGIIDRGTETTFEGKLSPYFEYLEDYVNEKAEK
jgi:hypothetical protein